MVSIRYMESNVNEDEDKNKYENRKRKRKSKSKVTNACECALRPSTEVPCFSVRYLVLYKGTYRYLCHTEYHRCTDQCGVTADWPEAK